MSDMPERADDAVENLRADDAGEAAPEFKPTPARVMAATEEESPEHEPQVEQAVLEVDGEAWSVRVLGRSGGRTASAVPLMLLGFWSGDVVEGDPVREHVAVGRSLDAMSVPDLREALARARPWRPPAKASERPERPRGERREGATRRRRT